MSCDRKFEVIVKNGFLTVAECCSRKVVVNEQTSIASIFAFNQFLRFTPRGWKLRGIEPRLKIAFGMRENLIRTCGKVSSVIQSSPNGLETNCWALWNFLSNLLLATTKDEKVQLAFLDLTGTLNVLEGFQKLVNQPFLNVLEIYALGSVVPQVHQPSLPDLNIPEEQKIPNQWSLALKFNQSGALNFIPGGPGNLDFDCDDQIWIANNVRQGTGNSSSNALVLNSDGSPAKISPLFGGGLLGSGFGVTSSPDRKTIAFGNFGWGETDHNPQKGSISLFKKCGCALTDSQGLSEKLARVQGLIYDRHGNLWCTSWGSQAPLGLPGNPTFEFASTNSGVTVYPAPVGKRKPVSFTFDSPDFAPFDIAIGPDGCGFIANSGNLMAGSPSSIYKLKLEKNTLVEVTRFEFDSTLGLRQVLVRKVENVYEVLVASVLLNQVLRFTLDLQPLTSIQGPLRGPWGMVEDPCGNLFTANFFREEPLMEPFGVGYLPKEGQSGFLTLPSAGDPVTLANGFPLFGSGSLPSFSPLMRQTAVNIDRAGNLWVLNNWKPRLAVDLMGNPGGDGFIAFLGIAAPRSN